MAHKLQSSKRCTKKSSVASCNANKLSAVYLSGSGESSLEISRTCQGKSKRGGGGQYEDAVLKFKREGV